MESYVKARGVKFLNVGWAERGNGQADGHGNSVPRFHLPWGTGPDIVRAFADPVKQAAESDLVEFRFRHMVDEIIVDAAGRAVGVKGRVLQDDDSPRGVKSSRVAVGDFKILGAPAVLISSGGIGGNLRMVKANWPVDRLGPKAPEKLVIGVPSYVDGRMLDISERVGANIINRDRMWHYTEGLQNWDPIWPQHAIRILPGPSSIWLDATGKRLPPFLYPGSDSLATLKYICQTGYDYTWFVLNETIIKREFALSGSEQNPELTNKSYWNLLKQLLFQSGAPESVRNFKKHGEDFIVEDNLPALVAGMNKLAALRGGPSLDLNKVREVIESRDSQVDNPYSKDAQVMLINNARNFEPEKRRRIAPPHKILDEAHGPLIAVRLNILSRKTLGGIETNLSSNVMKADGTCFPGLYAAGEAAGFGGGGVHGYNALEGSFVGGCIFSGLVAGRAIAK